MPTHDGRPVKTTDAILDDLLRVMGERDDARLLLAQERVAHRLTTKQLQEVTGMALR